MTNLVYLILGAAAIVAGTGIAFEILRRLIAAIARRAKAQPATVRSITDVLSVVWVLVAAYGVIAYTGLTSLLTLLTISGVVGLAISLALQTTLSNVVAGVLLLNDRLLRLGDEISFGGVRGTIVRIALRNTWVRTADGDIAVIGNSNLMSGPLVNYAARARFERQFRADHRVIEAEASGDKKALKAATEVEKSVRAETNDPPGA